MLNLPLDPTDDRADPVFRDVAGCEQWLGQFQLTNLQQAHTTLHNQIGELNRYPMRGLERLQVLELLRETVSHLQDDYARKLVTKPLPLGKADLQVFQSIVGLWQGMVTGYQRCLQNYEAGDRQLLPYGALLCQRCLNYSGLKILEYLRTGYEFEGSLWHQMHALYAFAEEQGIHLAEVEDELDARGPASSCRTIYIKTLLATYAHPEELSRSQLQQLDRWLVQWSPSLSLERNYSTSRGDAPPLAVDLDSTLGLQQLSQVDQRGGNLRFLAMVPLSKLLRVKIILLEQGQAPQQLELGSGMGSAECAQALTRLHHCWCEDHPERKAERRDTVREIHLCYGLEAIYAHVANKPFRQARSGSRYSDDTRNQIATFGRVLNDTSRHDLAKMGFVTEAWEIEDESLLGARLLRQETGAARISPRQILATRHDAKEICTLAVVVWLTVTLSGQLHAGIRYLPGVPEALAAKAVGPSGSASAEPALLLPAVAKLRTPASLIIPRGLFKAGGKLEITSGDGKVQKVEMGFSVERGVDYERISFTPEEG